MPKKNKNNNNNNTENNNICTRTRSKTRNIEEIKPIEENKNKKSKIEITITPIKKNEVIIDDEYNTDDDFINDDEHFESTDDDYEQNLSEEDDDYKIDTSEEEYNDDDFIDDTEEDSEKTRKAQKLLRKLIRRSFLKTLKTRLNEENDESCDEEDEYNEEDYDDSSSQSSNYNKYLNRLPLQKREELKMIEEQIKKMDENIDAPIKFSILSSHMDDKYKLIALRRLECLEQMDTSDHEYYKLRDWIGSLVSIPFGKYIDLPVKINDESINIAKFIYDVKKQMDESVYGMDDSKDSILQVVAQWISNPNSISNPLALYGPPGTGKTSLVRDGIAKALGRPFHMISLGGFKDSATLVGHDYTYIGAKFGQLVEVLIKSNCMNPVIYFDELDKLSDTASGMEIIGVLTHLIDTSQNTSIQDKYFSGINFDFSKCLFIFSYNDQHKIDSILADRLLTIRTHGYKNKEKVEIARRHLIPKLLQNTGLSNDDIKFSDSIIDTIVNKYTNGEEGVRNLKRCLDLIILKINLVRFFDQSMMESLNLPYKIKNIKLPVEVDEDIISELLKLTRLTSNQPPPGMYV